MEPSELQLWPEVSRSVITHGDGWPLDARKMLGVGDLDSNGFTDVAMINAAGQLVFYPRKSGMEWDKRRVIGYGWDKFVDVLGGVDLNSDSTMDLLARSGSGNLVLYPGNGRGGFAGKVQLGSGFQAFKRIMLLRNGVSQKPTLLAVTSDGLLRAYPFTAAGKLGSARSIAGRYPQLVRAWSIDDVDKNGYSDLMFVDSAQDVVMLVRQQANNTFTAPVPVARGAKALAHLQYCGASATSTCVYAVTKTGVLQRHNFQYRGANRAFVPVKGSRPHPLVGYRAPAGFLQPVAKIKPVVGTNVLTPGFNGVKVLLVQKRLGIWYRTRLATMDYGTVSAVRAFQRRVGLSATGTVNLSTWKKLNTGYSWTVDGYQAKPVPLSATKSQRIEAMVATARKFLGAQYTWGGAGPYELGIDCSGLVLQALYAAGFDPQPINVLKHAEPTYRSSRALYSHKGFKHYPLAQRKRGDLLFWKRNGVVFHVGLYLGDNKVLHTDYMGKPARIEYYNLHYRNAYIASDVVRALP